MEDVKSGTHASSKILNEVSNRNKEKSPVNTVFRSDSREIADPTEVANRSCRYFSSIGPNLAAKTIKLPQYLHKDYLSASFKESIFFNSQQKGE